MQPLCEEGGVKPHVRGANARHAINNNLWKGVTTTCQVCSSLPSAPQRNAQPHTSRPMWKLPLSWWLTKSITPVPRYGRDALRQERPNHSMIFMILARQPHMPGCQAEKEKTVLCWCMPPSAAAAGVVALSAACSLSAADAFSDSCHSIFHSVTKQSSWQPADLVGGPWLWPSPAEAAMSATAATAAAAAPAASFQSTAEATHT